MVIVVPFAVIVIVVVPIVVVVAIAAVAVVVIPIVVVVVVKTRAGKMGSVSEDVWVNGATQQTHKQTTCAYLLGPNPSRGWVMVSFWT